ncbi:hypothetical protein [Haloarchaeobius sp. HRN-SO-5]|uniref:hypothetical protein n=1 Tax=Haloarchaeobius sp. HRN-SO-5 TaxID=3446118 RepID=UPI003EBFB742
MNRTFVSGLVLTVAGLAGYVAGVVVAYPGRELSLVSVMLGLTTMAVGAGGVGR